MKVKEAMHPGVEWVSPETSVTKLAQLMRDHDIGAIPIGENDHLVGMVTDRDIVLRGIADGKDTSKLKARDVMSKGIICCRAEEDMDDAARTMELRQVRRLPVIDPNKRMIGILSLGDVANSCPQEQSGEVLQSVTAHH